VVSDLGLFDTKQEAALAYDREARQCGEDKLLNYGVWIGSSFTPRGVLGGAQHTE
jgi:hypothetical protein